MVLIFLFSCFENSKYEKKLFLSIEQGYHNYLKAFNSNDIYVALGVDSYDTYVLNEDNKIFQIPIYSIYPLYKEHFKTYTFNKFLENLLNHNLKIKESYLYKISFYNSFYLNKTVNDEYQKIGFEKFRDKYSMINNECNCYIFKMNKLQNLDKNLTIKFIFYQNGIYTQSNSNRTIYLQ